MEGGGYGGCEWGTDTSRAEGMGMRRMGGFKWGDGHCGIAVQSQRSPRQHRGDESSRDRNEARMQPRARGDGNAATAAARGSYGPRHHDLLLRWEEEVLVVHGLRIDRNRSIGTDRNVRRGPDAGCRAGSDRCRETRWRSSACSYRANRANRACRAGTAAEPVGFLSASAFLRGGRRGSEIDCGGANGSRAPEKHEHTSTRAHGKVRVIPCASQFLTPRLRFRTPRGS